MSKKIIIVKDTRESNNYIYRFRDERFADKVQLLRDALPCGDFSLAGYSKEIFIERKTMSDLVGSFNGGHRERFEKMWQRACELKIPHKFLLIEGTLAEAFAGEYRSEFHQNSLAGSLCSWSIKYKFNFFTVRDTAEGQVVVYYLLSNFLRLKFLEAKNEKTPPVA